MWRLVTLGLLTEAYDCSFSLPDGEEYDLSVLRRTNPPDFSALIPGLYEFRANVCSQTFQSCNGDFTAIATQWNIGGSCVAVLGRQNPVYGGLNPPTVSYLDVDNPGEGISVQYLNGDVCIDMGFIERSITYNIRCDPDEKGVLINAAETSPCVYKLDFLSKAGCVPGSKANLNDNSTKTGKRRISRGTWILVTVTVGLTLYCGLGILINRKQHGLELLESIPNKQFWQEIPGLVQEGVAFTIMKLRRWKNNDFEGRISI